ncbi:MAG: hypothetical protein ACR2LC_08490 [Pyrinomonadaceae bacterium]
MILPWKKESSGAANKDAANVESAPLAMRQTSSRKDEDKGGLEEAFEKERDDMRERLRGELKREPTEKELDEWLQRHTEGY